MITTLYDKLKSRKYTQYTTCQFPGCSKELNRIGKDCQKKYCCLEHAKEAQKLYRREWELRNKKRVQIWKSRYAKKRWKRIKNGELPNPNLKKHED